MKRILIALALIAAPACTTIPAAPSNVANATALDEKLGIAVEAAYTAAARSAALAIRLGLVSGATVEPIQQRARAAVLAVRAAYDAGNATSYSAAAEQALALINQLTGATGDRP